MAAGVHWAPEDALADTALAHWVRALARDVVAPARVDELVRWMASQPDDVVRREQMAAIEVCIWMAHADGQVDPEERFLLRRIVETSALDPDTADDLIASMHEPPPLDRLEHRLTHPVLREVLLAIAWDMALADGRVATEETAFYEATRARLGVPMATADAIRSARRS